MALSSRKENFANRAFRSVPATSDVAGTTHLIKRTVLQKVALPEKKLLAVLTFSVPANRPTRPPILCTSF